MRLVGGEGPYEGNVEVIMSGRKFRVCDDHWEDVDATVVCGMLGYT